MTLKSGGAVNEKYKRTKGGSDLFFLSNKFKHFKGLVRLEQGGCLAIAFNCAGRQWSAIPGRGQHLCL